MPQTTPRPKTLPSISYKLPTGLGNMFLSVTWYNGNIFEIFGHIRNSGSNEMADLEGLTKLVTQHLRSGGHVEDIIEQLSGISGDSPIWNEGTLIKSLPDAVAYVLNLARDETKAVHLWRLRVLLSSTGMDLLSPKDKQAIQINKFVNSLIKQGIADGTYPMEISKTQSMMLNVWEDNRVAKHSGTENVPSMELVAIEYNRRTKENG